MSEDRNILQAIGRLLQRYQKGTEKRKPALESKIGAKNELQKIASKDPYLNSLMLVGKMDGRTDEGALMEMRSKYPGLL